MNDITKITLAKVQLGIIDKINMATPDGQMAFVEIVVYGKPGFLDGMDGHKKDSDPNPLYQAYGETDEEFAVRKRKYNFEVAKIRRSNNLKLWALLRSLQICKEQSRNDLLQMIGKFIRDYWGIPNPQDIYHGDINKFSEEFTSSNR